MSDSTDNRICHYKVFKVQSRKTAENTAKTEEVWNLQLGNPQ